jgi:acyl carrier protein
MSERDQSMTGKAEIIATLSEYLQGLFDIDPEKISVEARLFEDLDLDSIDAVDLIVKLQEYTGKKIAPTEFKTVRTIGDVVDKLHDQLAVRT